MKIYDQKYEHLLIIQVLIQLWRVTEKTVLVFQSASVTHVEKSVFQVMPFRIQAVDLSVFGRQAHDRLSGGVNVPCGRFAAVRKADLYQGGIIVVEPFWSNFGDTEIRSLPNMKSILCNLGALFTVVE